MNNTEWRALIRRLRKHFPVAGRVSVRRCPAKSYCGITRFDGNNYSIRIDSTQPRAGQIDTLLHEWAHVLAIEQAYRHEGPWGTLYASIYDAWVRDFKRDTDETHVD